MYSESQIDIRFRMITMHDGPRVYICRSLRRFLLPGQDFIFFFFVYGLLLSWIYYIIIVYLTYCISQIYLNLLKKKKSHLKTFLKEKVYWAKARQKRTRSRGIKSNHQQQGRIEKTTCLSSWNWCSLWYRMFWGRKM